MILSGEARCGIVQGGVLRLVLQVAASGVIFHLVAVCHFARLVPVAQRRHAGPAGGNDQGQGGRPRRLGGHQKHQVGNRRIMIRIHVTIIRIQNP